MQWPEQAFYRPPFSLFLLSDSLSDSQCTGIATTFSIVGSNIAGDAIYPRYKIGAAFTLHYPGNVRLKKRWRRGSDLSLMIPARSDGACVHCKDGFHRCVTRLRYSLITGWRVNQAQLHRPLHFKVCCKNPGWQGAFDMDKMGHCCSLLWSTMELFASVRDDCLTQLPVRCSSSFAFSAYCFPECTLLWSLATGTGYR